MVDTHLVAVDLAVMVVVDVAVDVVVAVEMAGAHGKYLRITLLTLK